jgi:hypothetical protein
VKISINTQESEAYVVYTGDCGCQVRLHYNKPLWDEGMEFLKGGHKEDKFCSDFVNSVVTDLAKRFKRCEKED